MPRPPLPAAGWLAATALSTCACLGCNRAETEGTSPTGSAAPSASSAEQPARARRPRQAPLAGERVEVPEGQFFAGSVPGEVGRKPELEQRRKQVTLGAFTIDKLPYPNDPSQKPRTGIDRDQAERLCAERGARLCTELEWERACKGPKSDLFAGGSEWHASCAENPASCASGFEVLGMGALREWTASDVVPTVDDLPRRAAVRGAAPDAPGPHHRCARRGGIDSSTTSGDLGFRCCKGPPNAATVPEPKLGQTFKKKKIPLQRLAAMLTSHPKTKALSNEVIFFREPEAANTVVARGPGDRKGFLFTVTPLLWNPVPGAEFLVVAARSGKDTSFVVVYHVLGDDEFQLASSFVMKREPGPVALAYSGYIRPRLHFSTCWGCPGETGKILYRDPDSAIVLQP